MKKSRGFTIIELLIALSILSVIAAAAVASFSSVNRIVDLQKKNDETVRDMRGFVERLDTEIGGAVYIERDKSTLFFSQRKDTATGSTNGLFFTTIVPQEYLELGTRGEIVAIQYIVEQNESASGLLLLKKRTLYNPIGRDFRGSTAGERALPEPASFSYSGGGVSEYIVREDFSVFQLRFYGGGKWHESWDSEKMNGLPDSVELIFSLGDRKYREIFNVFISES
ncbi:MAG: prepilin-type N-terminal cleavage/methylation domain-containing protein [Spirochaetes bacterium]|nr:prepilin-type N-terminal cleavage/methylation domain-containing protein [Spirochaetota bacterium]